jgi:hypothetical protein
MTGFPGMDDPGDTRCSVCGGTLDEEVILPGVGRICPTCLMAGSFLGATGGLRLDYVADKMFGLSQAVRSALTGVIDEGEHLARQSRFDDARKVFLGLARNLNSERRPLLGFLVLRRALRLPGQSVEVYEQLGLTARALDCKIEAIQYLKTASWLAAKSSRSKMLARVIAALRELAPADDWIEKAEQMLTELGKKPPSAERCAFCGREAAEAGPLISGESASVCSACIKRLMALDLQKEPQ